MKLTSLLRFSVFGLSTILFKRRKPILGTIIVTDRCNLHCKHCSVNNITAVMYPYEQIMREMRQLYAMGIRILFLSGGETLLWRDGEKTARDLVVEAKRMGFLIVNVVTNGTQGLNLPEADLLMLSLDGDREHHNAIRSDTYDTIMANIDRATAPNILLYMAINQLNKGCIEAVCRVAREKEMVRCVSFNFHTPHPDTRELALTPADKEACAAEIVRLMDAGYPIFNLRSALPATVHNTFPTPCYQCVVMENGKLSTCGRCVHVPGLCEKCGYFFASEYTQLFSGRLPVMWEMLRTYPRFL